ncbi:hypothetical protein KIL84_020646 [Mauremys mutica]|uniref:Uncharacterized protein n=1 Tax=Mauremys mutica TaxID=74926 RepID=A0A9D3WPT0_9SAUR|nr:hypothetical protein KIL84_020646 [Mauremys mutica]
MGNAPCSAAARPCNFQRSLLRRKPCVGLQLPPAPPSCNKNEHPPPRGAARCTFQPHPSRCLVLHSTLRAPPPLQGKDHCNPPPTLPTRLPQPPLLAGRQNCTHLRPLHRNDLPALCSRGLAERIKGILGTCVPPAPSCSGGPRGGSQGIWGAGEGSH